MRCQRIATGGTIAGHRERVEAFTSGNRYTSSTNSHRTSASPQTQHKAATFAVSRAGPPGDVDDDSLSIRLHAHAQSLSLEFDVWASENLYRSRKLPSDSLVARFLEQR